MSELMKREIKFRGYINNQRVFNNIDIETMCKSEAVRNYDWSKLKIVEYTGIKDKNGVEIYEGDIVKLPKTRFSVKTENSTEFKKAPYLYVPKDEEWIIDIFDVVFENSSFRCRDHNPLSSWMNKLEVIGTIYENPELLQQCKY